MARFSVWNFIEMKCYCVSVSFSPHCLSPEWTITWDTGNQRRTLSQSWLQQISGGLQCPSLRSWTWKQKPKCWPSLPGLAKTIWRAGMSSRHAGRSSGTSDIYATICHGGQRQGTTAPSHNCGAEDNIRASSQGQLSTDQARWWWEIDMSRGGWVN